MPESDLDYVKGAFDIHHEVQYKYPFLAASLDPLIVDDMIYLHDAGEIIMHDLAHTVPDYEMIHDRWKKREAAAFRLLTRDYIEDADLRDYARGLYDRYCKKSPDDKEAQFVNLVYKVQAVRFGLEFVFNGHTMNKSTRQQQVNHAFGLVINPASTLNRLLIPSAQSDLASFTLRELERFNSYGYRKAETKSYLIQAKQLLGV